jgi:hypothetical protein
MGEFIHPITAPKFCIFCGRQPIKKTLEHVLPQWLLRKTGDPNRMVNFGIHFETSQAITFSFDQFRFPACTDCNQKHSILEGEAQKAINALLKNEPAPAGDFYLLLDWLDKVRTGLWLGYRYLNQNHFDLKPNFAIDQRIGIKDRLLAVYHFDSNDEGLTIWGADTPLFQFAPSAFALRINNLVLLNASWDFLCASRCGFPFPRTMRFLLDKGNLLDCSDFKCRNKITHPIIKDFYKPVVLLLQPILQDGLIRHSDIQTWMQEYPFLHNYLWPGQTNQGVLFRQFNSKTVPIDNPQEMIAFDEVTLHEAYTLKDITIQPYQLQVQSIEWVHAQSSDPQKVQEHSELYKRLIRYNQYVIHKRQSMTKEEYSRLWEKQSATISKTRKK